MTGPPTGTVVASLLPGADEATLAAIAVSALFPAAVVAGLLWAVDRIEPAPVAPLAAGTAVVGAAGTVVASGALPMAGLLVVPLYPIPLAYAVFAVLVWRWPTAMTFDRALAAILGASVVSLAVFLLRGTVRFGARYTRHVLLPPSLLAASVALAVTALLFFPLGRAAYWRVDARWPLAALAVLLPPAATATTLLRPYDVTAGALPAVFALVATLLGVLMFRLGHAVAARQARRRPAGE